MKAAKLFWIFILSSMIGFLIENGYRFFLTGNFVWHRGVIIGPFLPIYGMGACVFTLVLRRVHSTIKLFILGALIGGVTEFLGSLIKEVLLGIKLWDYSHHPFNLLGRISLVYLCFWGILCVLFIKIILPFLSDLIEKSGLTRMKNMTRIVFLVFTLNLTFSGLALQRWNERQSGASAENQFERRMDYLFPDKVLEKVYPSLEQSN
ncbi:MAG: putative ABC transporter permease [Enterococcus sp.]